MSSRNWADKLSLASSEYEVVRIARDYVGEWFPDDLAELPEHCRPGKIRDGEDINELAFKLTHLRFTPGYETSDEGLLPAMESFFAQACSRIAQVNSAQPN
jgi:hypothetical protein